MLSPSSVSPFFTFVLWFFIPLLFHCYAAFILCSSHGHHCMSRSKLLEGKAFPEAMYTLSNLASHKSSLLPLVVKAVQNPNSCGASYVPEHKPKSHIPLHYRPSPSVCSVAVAQLSFCSAYPCSLMPPELYELYLSFKCRDVSFFSQLNSCFYDNFLKALI